jgi:hypothetical protein
MISLNELTPAERKILKKLNTPAKIQDFLDSLKMNFSEDDPCLSPREVLAMRTAHCMEGALLAAAALWFHGHKPLLLDLTTSKNDEDHVVALFQVNGCWGAISKTNHAVLRYREPVYKTVRELAMSYFHEYFLHTGQKTLRTYSHPFDLSKHARYNWITSRDNIMDLIQTMSDSKHYQILNKRQLKNLRKADKIEIAAGKIVEWEKPKTR